MASNYTTNYQLSQWEAGDQVLRTEFNQDNQKIDTALAGLDSRTEALETSLSELGNCRIVCTSYVGTGTSGFNGQAGLTFDEEPRVIIIINTDGNALFLYNGMGIASFQGEDIYVSWHPTSVSWYSDVGAILNGLNISYPVIFIYQIEA